MKKAKTIVSLVIILTILCSMFTGFCVNAGAETTEETTSQDGKYTYTINSDNTVTLTKCKVSTENEAIPEEIDGKNVTQIGEKLFEEPLTVAALTIPVNIKKIDRNAFNNCTNLKKIYFNAAKCDTSDCFSSMNVKELVIGDTVEFICRSSFAYMQELKKVTIEGNTLKEIGDYAFQWDAKITSFEMPDSVTYLGSNAFDEARELKSIRLSKNVRAIKQGTFYCCKLETFDFSNISTIGESAFSYNLFEKLDLPWGLTKIFFSAFSGCDYLTDVKLPASLISIDAYAFSYCSKLSTVKLSNGLKSIGCEAFLSCPLDELVVPSTVTYIGRRAFDTKIKTRLVIPSSVTTFEDSPLGGLNVEDLYWDIPETKTEYFNNADIKNLHLGENVKSLSDDCFNFMGSIETVEVKSQKFEHIGSRVFKNTAWYKNLPEGEIYLGNALIGYKEGVTPNFEIKSGISCIADNALKNSDVISLKIPESVKYIGQYAFSDCPYLVSAEMDATDIEEIPVGMFSNCGFLQEFSIPQNVKVIGDYAFNNCHRLRISSYSKELVSIGKYAFSECDSISGFYFGSKLQKIDKSAFCGCQKINTENLPDSLTQIGDYAFSDCDAITSVNIPSGVTQIGAYAFSDCLNLKEVSLPDNMETVSEGCFCNCPNLSKVRLGENLHTISTEAFSYCSSLKSIYIPEQVSTAGSLAFYNTSIRKYYLPYSLKNIGDYAFGSYNGTKIYSHSPEVEQYCKKHCISFIKTYSPVIDYDIHLVRGQKELVDLPDDVIKCTCENSEIAEYNNGYVVAKQKGTTVISLHLINGDIYKCNVDVVAGLTASNLIMNSGKTKKISVIDGKAKSFSVSNSSVIKVDNTGMITALNKGTAHITVTLTTGEELICTVKVKSSPSLNKSTVTIKKGQTAVVKLTGKAESIGNKYYNAKFARITSKANESTLTIKGLKQGTTKLKIKVNNVKIITLNVKIR